MEITRSDGAILGIGKIPGRSRKALYRMHGCRIDPVAYFSNDEDAQWVESFLLVLCEAIRHTPSHGIEEEATPV